MLISASRERIRRMEAKVKAAIDPVWGVNIEGFDKLSPNGRDMDSRLRGNDEILKFTPLFMPLAGVFIA